MHLGNLEQFHTYRSCQTIISMWSTGWGDKAGKSWIIVNCHAIITLRFLLLSVDLEVPLSCLCLRIEISLWAQHGVAFSWSCSTAKIYQKRNLSIDYDYNWSIMGLSDLVIGLSILQSEVFFCFLFLGGGGIREIKYYNVNFLLVQKKGPKIMPCIIYQPLWINQQSNSPTIRTPQPFWMDWPHCCFYFQEVNLFQRADKESSCSWKFPLLHHWPKWKQSAHSRWTLWFPLPIPQTSQVWGLIVHILFTLQICSLWRPYTSCTLWECERI